jgi:hypothetical protein
LEEKTLVKSLLISILDKVIDYKGTFLQGSTKALFRYNQLKKIALFSTCFF